MKDSFSLYPLHIFRLVARHGSVTHAAQELSISQPGVSAHIRALESQYGVSLFERTPRGMLLTEAGAILLERADRLFALYQEMPSAVTSAAGAIAGAVTLAASSTPGAYLLPGLLRRFEEQHPRAQPTLSVGDSGEVLAWLHDYRAALGVVGERFAEGELMREKIGSDELRLITGGGDPLHRVKQVKSEHLRGRTLFLREQGSSTRAGAEILLGNLRHEFTRVVELTRTEAIKQCVAEGMGVAVLSSWATKLEEAAGLLRPVRDRTLRHERTFYLVRRRDRELSGIGAALWEHLTIPSKIPRTARHATK